MNHVPESCYTALAGQRIRIGRETGEAEAVSVRRAVWFAGADERALGCRATGDPEPATTR